MSRPWREPRLTPDEKDGSGKFSKFAGLVNTRSRKDLGLSALYVGDNVLISDSKKITRRAGYSLVRAGDIQSVFGVGDNFYIVDAGELLRLASLTDARSLTAGLTGAKYGWAEINGDGYFVNGVEAGIVRGDTFLPWRLAVPSITSVSAGAGVLPSTTLNIGATYTSATWRFCATYETSDGRETAPSDVLELTAPPTTSSFNVSVSTAYAHTNVYLTEPDGTVFRLAAQTTSSAVTVSPAQARRELTTYGTSSLPSGVTAVEFFQGRCFAAEYLPQLDISVLWISKPLAFHLFNQAEDFIMLPGELSMLVECNEGLLLGTTQKIYQYKEDGVLKTLANYGVVPGTPGDKDAHDVAYFWTQRGVCKAMPFVNMSEENVGMAPGVRAASRVVYMNGMQQFITVTQGGGEIFNVRIERE